jgi:hypothetical protein
MLFHVPVAVPDLLRGAILGFILEFFRVFATALTHGFRISSFVTSCHGVQTLALRGWRHCPARQVLQFLDDLLQHVAPDGIMNPVPAFFSFYEARLFQNLEMLGYSSLRDAQALCKGSSAQILGQEQIDKLKTGLVGQGLQDGNKVSHGARKNN